jgi:hypothetical protein
LYEWYKQKQGVDAKWVAKKVDRITRNPRGLRDRLAEYRNLPNPLSRIQGIAVAPSTSTSHTLSTNMIRTSILRPSTFSRSILIARSQRAVTTHAPTNASGPATREEIGTVLAPGEEVDPQCGYRWTPFQTGKASASISERTCSSTDLFLDMAIELATCTPAV